MTLDELFNAHRSQLGENDLYIWNYITAHRRECAALSIEALGRRCNVSRTTILRFAHKLGLHGFSELKVLLRMEDKQQHALPDYIEQTCAVYTDMIADIRAKDCTALFRRIDEAENLYVFSSGMLQDAVARELCRAFLSCGKWFYTIHAGTEADVLLHNVTERDLVIILSVSGESPQVLQLARAARAQHPGRVHHPPPGQHARPALPHAAICRHSGNGNERARHAVPIDHVVFHFGRAAVPEIHGLSKRRRP